MRLDDIARLLQGNMTPIIAANAAIIAFISSRNVHLSDRARANVDESVYKIHQSTLILTPVEKQARLVSLRKQNTRFIARYIGTSVAFVLASLAFILFCISSVVVGNPGLMKQGAKMAILAAAITGLSFLLLVAEFIYGHVTLRMNNQVMKSFKGNSPDGAEIVNSDGALPAPTGIASSKG